MKSGNTRVEVDVLFFDSRFLLYEHRQELSEQLPHDIHALLACLHIIESVPHGEKDRLHSSSVRCGVELCITLVMSSHWKWDIPRHGHG